jgi:RNA polymerase sigma factor (sigma-70 family)
MAGERRPMVEEKQKQAEALRKLSERERQVLVLVVEGRTSKEIARIVGVKPASVDTYRSRIMAKLDIGDLPSLVRFAIRHGLIKP